MFFFQKKVYSPGNFVPGQQSSENVLVFRQSKLFAHLRLLLYASIGCLTEAWPSPKVATELFQHFNAVSSSLTFSDLFLRHRGWYAWKRVNVQKRILQLQDIGDLSIRCQHLRPWCPHQIARLSLMTTNGQAGACAVLYARHYEPSTINYSVKGTVVFPKTFARAPNTLPRCRLVPSWNGISICLKTIIF